MEPTGFRSCAPDALSLAPAKFSSLDLYAPNWTPESTSNARQKMIGFFIRFMAHLCSLFGIGLVECCAKSFCQFDSVVIGPKVHEKQPWLFVEHVTVQSGDFYPAFPQRLDDRVDLFADQNEIASDRRLV